METLKYKMLKAIKSVPDVDRYFENYEAFAEACARVAEEEIAKATYLIREINSLADYKSDHDKILYDFQKIKVKTFDYLRSLK